MLDLLTRVWFILLMMPTHSTDRAETNAERATRTHQLATDITEWTDNPETLAVLLTIGERESFFAKYVGEGRCSDGPPGMRCDEGRARSFFQLHRMNAPQLWTYPQGSNEALVYSFGMARRVFWDGLDECRDSVAGAFARYKGRPCKHPDGRSRAKLYRIRLCQLTTQEPWPEVMATCR